MHVVYVRILDVTINKVKDYSMSFDSLKKLHLVARTIECLLNKLMYFSINAAKQYCILSMRNLYNHAFERYFFLTICT